MYTPNNIEKNKTNEIFSSLYFGAPTSPLLQLVLPYLF